MLQPTRPSAEATEPPRALLREGDPLSESALSGAGLRDAGSACSRSVPRLPTSPEAHPCILVVDDEPEVRLLARIALEERGFEVREAEDGRAALAILASDAALERPEIEAVLLDVTMPGIDGIEVLERSRSIREIPVLLSSGHPENAVRARLPSGLVVDSIRKPYTFDQLVERLAAVAGIATPSA